MRSESPASMSLTQDQRVGIPVMAHNVSKVYSTSRGPLVALHNVSLQISAGEFVAIVGLSGCGKSTLLRTLAGVIEATKGTVEIGNVDVRAPRRDVGLMLPRPTLLPWRKILANVLLPIQVHERVMPHHVAKAEALLDMVKLKRYKAHYPRELSDGMQQRVALARVLITDPHVLFLDEPFGMLDEFTKEGLNLDVTRIVDERHMTAIEVTHNVIEAVFMADRVIVMAGPPGCVVAQFPVTFSKPRSPAVMREDAFQKLVADIRLALGLE